MSTCAMTKAMSGAGYTKATVCRLTARAIGVKYSAVATEAIASGVVAHPITLTTKGVRPSSMIDVLIASVFVCSEMSYTTVVWST